MHQVFNLSRIIQVFGLFFIGGFILLIFAILILKRGKQPLNILIALYFIFIFIGGFLNVLYAFLTNQVEESIVVFLHILTYYSFCSAQVFIFIFNLRVLNRPIITNIKIPLVIFGTYSALFLGLFFIPEGVHINESTYYRPQWNLSFFIYANICLSLIIVPSLYTSFLVYRRFKVKKLKKKWFFYIIGTIIIYVELIGVGICIFINDPDLRALWNIYDTFVFVAIVFIYLGIKESKVKKK